MIITPKIYHFNGRRTDLRGGYGCSEPGDNTGDYVRLNDYLSAATPNLCLPPCSICGEPSHCAKNCPNVTLKTAPTQEEVTQAAHIAELECRLTAMTVSREGYRQDAMAAVELATTNRLRAEKAEARVRELETQANECGRWETGFRSIVTRTIGPRAPFDIPQIVNLVGAAWKQRNSLNARCEALADALRRTRRNFVLAIERKPVRDMTETLAECDFALRAVEE